jgi:thiol-disulfide isomerase/thioredoxin
MRIKFILLLLSIISLSSCIQVNNSYKGMAPGKWRGVIHLTESTVTPNPKGKYLKEKLDLKFDEETDGELPFNFDVVYESKDKFYLKLYNGKETIELRDIAWGNSIHTGDDTITIHFPEYGNYIKAIYKENVMDGFWVIPSKNGLRIPFSARYGVDYRFTPLKKVPATDLTGKWATVFEDKDEPFNAIGEFEQKDNTLSGTFRTETGDFRYLDGSIQKDKFYLSCFDGAHAFLLEGKIQNKDNLIGSFRSGTTYQTTFKSERNSKFSLLDPNKMTKNVGNNNITFALKNPEGKMISLNDPAYKGKVKVIQILGTWCPNCKDETEFLKDYISKNKDLVVIGISFERGDDIVKANEVINNYKKAMLVPYEIVYGGKADKSEVIKLLPQLDKFYSFPTTIFVDKNNKIQNIYTGFNGPATSEYENYKKDFDSKVKNLQNH